MIEETLGKIEDRLQQTEAIKDEQKAELLRLVSTLRNEVSQLSHTHGEQAQSITGFAAVSTHEATREEKDPKLVELSLAGLKSSVEGFEKSHPKLVQLVDRICTTLANLGV
ncbi:MAG: DUF4404 family protein [Verrucomicrobia bacterium]|nr:DUF4404 family protein [Verrucomicrobiota bacterium]